MNTHFIETREFEWKLHNFTKELAKCNKDFRTDKFSIFLDVDEIKLNFLIQIRESDFGVYLELKDSETDDFTVKCECFVKKLNGEKTNNFNFLRTKNEFDIGRGWRKFISIDDICKNSHQYLKDNKTLTLGMKVELTKKKEAATRQHDNEYQKLCKDYFTTKAYSDFKLICSDGIEIPVHRFVLAGNSSVMKTIFDTKNKLINITDIDGETMTEILRYIYTREVNNIKELAVYILYGAEKYELDKLKKICIASMIENLSVENAIEYFILADKYDVNVLLERSAEFIKSHHKELSKDVKNWNKLTKKYLNMLLDRYHQGPRDIQIFDTTF